MKARYPFVALAVLTLAMTALAIVFTVHYVDSDNHKFCSLIVAYTSGPAPSTAAGVARTGQLLQLGRSLGCQGVPRAG